MVASNRLDGCCDRRGDRQESSPSRALSVRSIATMMEVVIITLDEASTSYLLLLSRRAPRFTLSSLYVEHGPCHGDRRAVARRLSEGLPGVTAYRDRLDSPRERRRRGWSALASDTRPLLSMRVAPCSPMVLESLGTGLCAGGPRTIASSGLAILWCALGVGAFAQGGARLDPTGARGRRALHLPRARDRPDPSRRRRIGPAERARAASERLSQLVADPGFDPARVVVSDHETHSELV